MMTELTPSDYMELDELGNLANFTRTFADFSEAKLVDQWLVQVTDLLKSGRIIGRRAESLIIAWTVMTRTTH